MEITGLEIEVILRADDADAKMTQRELASFVEFLRVVKANRLTPVNERDTSRAGKFFSRKSVTFSAAPVYLN